MVGDPGDHPLPAATKTERPVGAKGWTHCDRDCAGCDHHSDGADLPAGHIDRRLRGKRHERGQGRGRANSGTGAVRG
ncbi:hypothetical protein D3C75_1237800 [compost metagenome]